MTAEFLEKQRVQLAREYFVEQRQHDEALAPTTDVVEAESEIPQTSHLVDTFAKICNLQSIDFDNFQNHDREDTAVEALNFVTIMYELGRTALESSGIHPQRSLALGKRQVLSNLREHLKSPDLEATDDIRKSRQIKKERAAISVAARAEFRFPQIEYAHKLMSDLFMAKKYEAGLSVRDIIIAMGMSVEQVMQRQRQIIENRELHTQNIKNEIATAE